VDILGGLFMSSQAQMLPNHLSCLTFQQSSRPRRQVKNARRRGFRHVENVFGRQRSHRALQPAAIELVIWIHSYMQNKPNFLESQMNVNSFNTVEYENKSNWTLGENKPKQTQFQTRCTLCEFFLFFTFLCLSIDSSTS
jgi:hypothetical protein